MNEFSGDELKTLLQKPKGLCVSIYMPTHRAGPGIQQDPIRLKNLLGEATVRLRRDGLGLVDTTTLLEPARKLLDDGLFWRYQSDGLALFLSTNFFRLYRVPVSFEELAVVTYRFHIKPLLLLLSGDGVFYVLALSQNEIRLLEGTRQSVSEVEFENIPASLAEALKYDDPERQLQYHTRAPVGKGKRMAIFHGHGVGIDDSKDRILRYFRQINQGLQELLRSKQAPLVLAGVEYLFPIYREVNTYPLLLSEGVPGNPEAVSTGELHRRAWSVASSYFGKVLEGAVSRYRSLARTEKTSNDLEEILRASCQGRVELLFVAVGVQMWGTFDQNAETIQFHQDADTGNEDLLDLATMQTLLSGGTVFALEPENVPDDSPLAAIFRY